MPLAMLAQTDTTMQKNNIEVLKAEAARKAAEAKAAAEKAQRAAEEALEAAKKAEQAAQEQGKAAKGWTIPAETPTKTKESNPKSKRRRGLLGGGGARGKRKSGFQRTLCPPRNDSCRNLSENLFVINGTDTR